MQFLNMLAVCLNINIRNTFVADSKFLQAGKLEEFRVGKFRPYNASVFLNPHSADFTFMDLPRCPEGIGSIR